MQIFISGLGQTTYFDYTIKNVFLVAIMTINIGILMDPISTINYKKDSSLAMLWAAKMKGWNIFYMEQNDLFIENGIARAHTMPLDVFEDPEAFYSLGEPDTINLGSLDAILMRKDPPFDQEYIYSTYILEMAEQQGSLIVNKPQSLRDCNEKVFATQFDEFAPAHLVTASDREIRRFYNEHKDIILKPLDGMGGTSIFRVGENDPNIGVIIETLTQFGSQTIMAQKFIPEISDGDKRILLVDGVPAPYCLARIPAKGETRGNLAAGGCGEARPLTKKDREIAEAVGPTLRKKGILFAGLDVIGDYLTEINVTSPTCIREIDDAYNTHIAEDLIDVIDDKLKKRT